MKIIFHNPHLNYFGVSIHDILSGRKGLKKYLFLIESLLNKPDVRIYFFIDRGSFSFFKRWNFLLFCDIFLWCCINSINPFKIRYIFDISSIQPDQLFFSFSTEITKDNLTLVSRLKNTIFPKLFHLTHFIFYTSRLNDACMELDNLYFCSENNLYKNSEFFRAVVPAYKKDVFVLPFAFQDRFERKVEFSERKNLCYATGTNHSSIKEIYGDTMKDIVEFLKRDTPFHPMRDWIVKNKSSVSSYIFNEIGERFIGTPPSKSGSKITALIKAYFSGNQSKYFSINIVSRFNEYEMFLVGEEICDLPGIAFVEGMACGCVYVGKIDPMYTDLGMVPGVHYIGYNGTPEDLKNKIAYFQTHTSKLGDISVAGYLFAINHFSKSVVGDKFFGILKSIQK